MDTEKSNLEKALEKKFAKIKRELRSKQKEFDEVEAKLQQAREQRSVVLENERLEKERKRLEKEQEKEQKKRRKEELKRLLGPHICWIHECKQSYSGEYRCYYCSRCKQERDDYMRD
ncbi:MAG: hypothetical protein H7831_11635 [Magnetococcus sp. WYHC-3]